LAQPFTVSGWAIDANAPTGTGVDAVHVNAYHNFGNGTPSYMLGAATYGDARPDVAAARGARFLNSGYHFTVSGQPPGWYRFVGWSHSTASGIWTGRTVDAYVDIPTVSLEINRSGTGTGAILGTGLNCPGGSTTQAMPCGASYAFNTIVTLTAVPDPGSTFAGWGGGCANVGTNPTCAVGLPGDRFAFAYFTKTPGTIATTYYHTDVVGSVRALSDQTGATVIRHDYLPFGEDTQPLAGDPLRFAGKELDPESALMNFEARYYRNTWGRFTQVDPVHVEAALLDPQQWNRYAYARNNPLAYGDPDGQFALHFFYFVPILGGPVGAIFDIIGAATGAFGGDIWGAIFGGGGSAQPPHHRDGEHDVVIGTAQPRNPPPLAPAPIDNPGPTTPMPDDPTTPTPNPGPPTPDPTPGQPQNTAPCAQAWSGLSVGYCGALHEGLAAAQQMLSKGGCGTFYGGRGSSVLSATRYRFLDLHNQNTGAGTQSIDSVFINSKGPYMTYDPVPGHVGPFGRFWVRPGFRAFILLHELGHQLAPITGFKPDANDRDLNEAQSRLVLSRCF
jgi:RHS repeat-associated protein